MTEETACTPAFVLASVHVSLRTAPSYIILSVAQAEDYHKYQEIPVRTTPTVTIECSRTCASLWVIWAFWRNVWMEAQWAAQSSGVRAGPMALASH